MKKKIILSIVAVLLVAIIVVISYFNFIRPLSINVTEVRCENWDATYVGVKAFEEMYNKCLLFRYYLYLCIAAG